MEKQIKIGAWYTNSVDGKKQGIKFTINGKKYVMFTNDYKHTQAHPDYIILESKPTINNTNTSNNENGIN